MKLKSPQPNQSFWHVAPSGNTYHSNDQCFITPLTSADEAALRRLGCVDGEQGVVRPDVDAWGVVEPDETVVRPHPVKEGS